MAEAAESSESSGKKGGSKLVIILMIVIIVLLLAVGGVVTWLLLSKSGPKAPAAGKPDAAHAQKKEEKPKGSPINIPLGQPITVNLNKPNDADLLQVQLTLVTYDPGVDKLVKDNRAEVINDIMLILSDVKAANLRTREGKEQLQKQLKDEINKILLKHTGKKDLVENVFFTKLLMQ